LRQQIGHATLVAMSGQAASAEQIDRLSKGQVIVVCLVMSLFALPLAALAHHGCTTYPADIPRPLPGSPRANYCAVADAGFPVLQLVIPLLVVGATAVLTQRSTRVVLLVAVVLTVLMFVSMLLASNLDAWGFDHSARVWQALGSA
jgi:hypothetical protein